MNTIEIRNLSKWVKKFPLIGTKIKILNNVNLNIEKGEFVGILGGSGSGKSTLIKCLTGINSIDSGDVIINGINIKKDNTYRKNIAYVPQEDIVHKELTIEEALYYSYEIRKGGKIDFSEASIKINQILRTLGLVEHKDKQIKKISGGQRKRVSIGVELLSDPEILFLDEPTSGLDPGLEKEMMEFLKELSQKGKTVVLVTHTTLNIKLCDKIAFLNSEGELVFHGTPQEAKNDFDNIANQHFYQTAKDKKYFNEKNKLKSFEYIYNIIDLDVSQNKKILADKYKNLNKKSEYIKTTSFEHEKDKKRKRKSFYSQWFSLMKRYLLITIKEKKNLFFLALVQPIIIGFLLWLVFSHSYPLFRFSDFNIAEVKITKEVIVNGYLDTIQGNIRDESNRRFEMSICTSLIIFSVIWLSAFTSSREIVKEIPIYKRERISNLSINAYLLSKIFVLIFIAFTETFIVSLIVAKWVYIPYFWKSFGVLFLISIASTLMGLLISALSPSENLTTGIVSIVLLGQIVLSGALVPIHAVKPEVFQRVFDLALSKWGYEYLGGYLYDINSRVSVENKMISLNSDFSGHLKIIVLWIVIFYIATVLALKLKDIKE